MGHSNADVAVSYYLRQPNDTERPMVAGRITTELTLTKNAEAFLSGYSER